MALHTSEHIWSMEDDEFIRCVISISTLLNWSKSLYLVISLVRINKPSVLLFLLTLGVEVMEMGIKVPSFLLAYIVWSIRRDFVSLLGTKRNSLFGKPFL